MRYYNEYFKFLVVIIPSIPTFVYYTHYINMKYYKQTQTVDYKHIIIYRYHYLL